MAIANITIKTDRVCKSSKLQMNNEPFVVQPAELVPEVEEGPLEEEIEEAPVEE